MGLLDKAKSAAETATSKAKEGIDDVQTKRELSQAHDALGKLAYELHSAGEVGSRRSGLRQARTSGRGEVLSSKEYLPLASSLPRSGYSPVKQASQWLSRSAPTAL